MSKNASSVKDRPLYKALRNEGIGKKKAVRVAEAVDSHGGPGLRLDADTRLTMRIETKTELLDRARRTNDDLHRA